MKKKVGFIRVLVQDRTKDIRITFFVQVDQVDNKKIILV